MICRDLKVDDRGIYNKQYWTHQFRILSVLTLDHNCGSSYRRLLCWFLESYSLAVCWSSRLWSDDVTTQLTSSTL